MNTRDDETRTGHGLHDEHGLQDAFSRLRSDVGAVSTDDALRRVRPDGTAVAWWPRLAGVAVLLVLLVGVVVVLNSDDGDPGVVASDPDPDPDPPLAPDPDDGGSLDDTAWYLVEGTGPAGAIPVVDGWPITLSFSRGPGGEPVLGGTAACNGYGSTYDLADGALQLTNLSATEMGCSTEVMASESAFLDAVLRLDRLARQDDQLILSGDGVELVFALGTPARVTGDDEDVVVEPEPLSVTELLEQRPEDPVEVVGHLDDRGGGPYLCEAAIADGFCGSRFVVLVGEPPTSEPGSPVTVAGTLDDQGRFVLDPGLVRGTPAEGEIVDALRAGDLTSEALPWHPDGVVLSLGGTALQQTVTPDALLDPATWRLDLEAFRGRVGPFSVIDLLAETAQTSFTIGTHAHCAAPPMPLPDVEFARQLVIQADGIDSCLQWFVVDVLVDTDGMIVAVNLDTWEP